MESIESKKPLSRELRAVLRIVTVDEELKRKVLPQIDVERESINWENIFNNDFGGGHSAALVWAKAIWCDVIATKSDPFDRAFAMDAKLRRAVIEALAIRWSIIE